jgi:hypothetical protein
MYQDSACVLGIYLLRDVWNNGIPTLVSLRVCICTMAKEAPVRSQAFDEGEFRCYYTPH